MRTIVAADFDGTLTNRDTLLEFIRFAKGDVRCLLGFLLFAPLLVMMILKLYPNWKSKQKLFSYFFSGMSLEEFNRLGRNFAAENRHLLRKGGVEMIEKAKQNGAEVVVISASIDNWVQPFFPDLRVIGTRAEVKNGLLTGRFSSKNCYGQEKVNRLLEVFPDRSDYYLIAYGDSKGDRKLLRFADEQHYKPFSD
jgi:phosphatidylglycerophosphatase C